MKLIREKKKSFTFTGYLGQGGNPGNGGRKKKTPGPGVSRHTKCVMPRSPEKPIASAAAKGIFLEPVSQAHVERADSQLARKGCGRPGRKLGTSQEVVLAHAISQRLLLLRDGAATLHSS